MKKSMALAVAAVALAGAVMGTASTATASVGKARACSACHARRTAVKVKVTRVRSTSATVTYKVAVTGGKGRAGWAVLSGGKNLARRTTSTGTFKIARGKTFRVWGVKKATGSNYYRTLTAR